jgi:hypothetical protein
VGKNTSSQLLADRKGRTLPHVAQNTKHRIGCPRTKPRIFAKLTVHFVGFVVVGFFFFFYLVFPPFKI